MFREDHLAKTFCNRRLTDSWVPGRLKSGVKIPEIPEAATSRNRS